MKRRATRESAMHESPGDACLTSDELAARARVSPTTLWRWRQAGRRQRVTWLSPPVLITGEPTSRDPIPALQPATTWPTIGPGEHAHIAHSVC